MSDSNTATGRRRFLGGLVGTVGAAGLPGVAMAEAAGGSRELDVIVVGAGFAGLAARRELAKSGLSVLLLEARNRIGGRTFTSAYQGRKVEMGGTWIHWSQPHVWNEITRYGLGLEESPGAAAETVSWLSGGRLHRSQAAPVWEKIAKAMERLCDVDGQGGRAVLPRAHDPLFRADLLARWDALSLADRLQAIKLNREMRDLLAPQLSINCHNDPAEAGFADMLRWWALGDYEMGRMFDKLGRYKIKEGMGELAARMLADAPGEVRLATPIRAVERQGEFSVVTTARGERLKARAVVMAVPLNVLGSIAFSPALSAGKQAMAAAGHTGRGSKCYIHIRQQVGNWMGMAPHPHPITLTWTEQQRDDGTLLVCFGPPGNLDITDEEAVQQALRRLLPGAEVLGVTGYQWDVDPYSRGTWCWYRPGQLTRGLPDLRRAENGLFMAGADLAEGWRGFVDGALESGLTAARDLRAHFGSQA